MKSLGKYLLSVVMLIIPVVDSMGLQDAGPDDLYVAGIEEIETGNFERAAELWITHAEQLDQPDFSLAHDLIKLVTQHRLTSFYEQASDLYFWGLESETIDDRAQERLRDELFFIESMIGIREKRQLEDKIQNRNREIFDYLAQFWHEKSITPADSYNERLLEHWERVHFAIRNFKASNDKLFDDRGGVYIRLGEPYRKRADIFNFNPGFVNYLITTRVDDGFGGNSFEDDVSTVVYLNTYYRVRDYHQYPSYEVWVYQGIADGRDSVVYLFGNRYGGSDLSLMRSVDDFIPSAAYSMGDRNSPITFGISNQSPTSGSGAVVGGQEVDRTNIFLEDSQRNAPKVEIITPALILQMMYYRQLASLDFYFSRQYEDMLDRYMNTTIPLSSSLARQFQQTNSARLLEVQAKAPVEVTSNRFSVFNLSSSVHPYRFYDEEMNPYYRVYFEDRITEAILFEELKKHNNTDLIVAENYELSRSVFLLSDDGDQIEIVRAKTNASEIPESEAIEQNVLKVPYREDAGLMMANSELHDISSGNATGISENSTLRKSLKGLGRDEIRLPDFSDESGLFISDVIMGYNDINANNVDGFVISHNGEIPAGHSIMFYYEAYNLPVTAENLYNFTLTYEIRRDRNFIGRLFRGRSSETGSISIENTTDTPRFTQLLEIVSDDLILGDYTLTLKITSENHAETLLESTIPIKITLPGGS